MERPNPEIRRYPERASAGGCQWPRQERAARRLGVRGRRQLQRVLEGRHASSCCCSTTRRRPEPARVIPLDPRSHRTYHYWHAFVPGLDTGPGLRISRARAVRARTRAYGSISDKVLLDPYGLAVAVPAAYDRMAASRPGRQRRGRDEKRGRRSGSLRLGGRCVRCAGPFARNGHLRAARARLHPAPEFRRRADRRGTYAGLVEKIPYLQDLGITAVELLPVFQFDPQDAPAGRVNYWGYQPVSFFAPHHAYSSTPRRRWPCSTNSATWSRRCTAPASK